jgi:hypothetical protein
MKMTIVDDRKTVAGKSTCGQNLHYRNLLSLHFVIVSSKSIITILLAREMQKYYMMSLFQE